MAPPQGGSARVGWRDGGRRGWGEWHTTAWNDREEQEVALSPRVCAGGEGRRQELRSEGEGGVGKKRRCGGTAAEPLGRAGGVVEECRLEREMVAASWIQCTAWVQHI